MHRTTIIAAALLVGGAAASEVQEAGKRVAGETPKGMFEQ